MDHLPLLPGAFFYGGRIAYPHPPLPSIAGAGFFFPTLCAAESSNYEPRMLPPYESLPDVLAEPLQTYSAAFRAAEDGSYQQPVPAYEWLQDVLGEPLQTTSAAFRDVYGFHYYVVVNLDFIGDGRSSCPAQVLEFSSVVINASTGEEATFHTFVSPDFDLGLDHSPLMCTAVQARDMAGGTRLEHALDLHERWLEQLGVKDGNFTLVAWGNDRLELLGKECAYKRVKKPGYFERWIDLQTLFSQMPGHHVCTIVEALQLMGMEWKGNRFICGFDYARNVGTILATLINLGLAFEFGSHARDRVIGPFRTVTWCPPPLGTVKVNFDGAVSQIGAGYGAVIRDEQGRIRGTVCGKGKGELVVALEAQGALSGLRLAKQLGYHHICLEGDSTTVIDWINGGSNPPLELADLVRDIRLEMESCTWKIARHILREGNQVADWLAQMGKERDEGEDVCLEGFHAGVVHVAARDMRLLFSIRY